MEVRLDALRFDGGDLGVLERMPHRLQSPSIFGFWDEVLDDVLDAERRLFASGRGFAPTKEATRKRKARDPDPRVRANANRVNVATGALREHMTTRSPSAQPLKLDADELQIGIIGGRHKVFYGRFQANQGRDPRVSKAVLRRIAKTRLHDHLFSR